MGRTYAHDTAKLPKWAQDHIRQLEQRLSEARAKIKEQAGKGPKRVAAYLERTERSEKDPLVVAREALEEIERSGYPAHMLRSKARDALNRIARADIARAKEARRG